MLVETLLPLGKLDPGLREPDTPLHIGDFATGAAQAEGLGFDAVLVEETKDDPFQLLALGAANTSTVGLDETRDAFLNVIASSGFKTSKCNRRSGVASKLLIQAPH